MIKIKFYCSAKTFKYGNWKRKLNWIYDLQGWCALIRQNLWCGASVIYKVDVRWYVKTYGAVRLCSAKSENCRRREKKLNIKFMI